MIKSKVKIFSALSLMTALEFENEYNRQDKFYMKKKIFLTISIIMLLIAVGFIIYALSHPEGSFPWSNTITYTIYLVYIVGMIGFFVASRRATK